MGKGHLGEKDQVIGLNISILIPLTPFLNGGIDGARVEGIGLA